MEFGRIVLQDVWVAVSQPFVKRIYDNDKYMMSK